MSDISARQQSHPSYRRYSSLPNHQTAHAVPQTELGSADNPVATTTLRRISPLSSTDTKSSFETPDIAALEHPQNIPIDYTQLDYVSNYDENLMCPICHSPFLDPVVLDSCDHCFCRGCMTYAWKTAQHRPGIPQGLCPTCRTPARLTSRSTSSKILVNILDELLVKCPREDQGCSAQVKRGCLDHHVNIYCDYEWMRCPSSVCTLRIRRKDLTQGVCSHHEVSCLDCRQTTSLPYLETHWDKDCADRQVACSACDEMIFYRQRSVHLQQDCPMTLQSCPGAVYGCIALHQRSKLQVHISSCPIATLAPYLRAQATTIETQARDQALLRCKLDILDNGLRTIKDLLDSDRVQDNASQACPSALPSRPQSSDLVAFSGQGLTPPLQSTRRLSAPRERLSRVLRPRSRSRSNTATPSHSPERQTLVSTQNLRAAHSTASNTATDAHGAPFVSHEGHLLSLHEALREEVARIANSLHDLQSRHGLLIFNEIARVQDETAHLRGQLGSVACQVDWLTHAKLQEPSTLVTTSLTAAPLPVVRASSALPTSGPSVALPRLTESNINEPDGVWRADVSARLRGADKGRTKL